MKKSYLSLTLLALTLGLAGCGGSSSSKAETTSSATSTNTSVAASSAKENTSATSTKGADASSQQETSVAASSVKEGKTYTGGSYDRSNFSGGNISLSIGSSDYTANNNSVSITYTASINNISGTVQDFTLSEVKLLSTNGDDFTSKCTIKFDGEFYTEGQTVIVYGGKSAKISFSASFTDENKDENTYYYNSFTVKDSENNVYYLTSTPEEEYHYFEREDIEIYEDSAATTADNGFQYTTEGSGSYSSDSYCYVSTNVLTITNTGSDTSCLFNIGTIMVYSIADPSSSCGFMSTELTLDGSRFYDYYDATDFNANSVLVIDFTGSQYGIMESDLPVQVRFTVSDMNARKTYIITYKMTSSSN